MAGALTTIGGRPSCSNSGYGEGAPRGNGPDQNRIRAEGSDYLISDFPELDSVVQATIE